MRDLLPPVVAVAVAGPADWAGELLPAELACLSDGAVESRRRDFTAGRACARRALAGLGLPVLPVPAATDRSPVWPAGVVGTITHTDGYCAAAAARSAEIRSVGMDAERHKELSPGVRRLICLPEEEESFARLPAGVSWPAVVFSVKESVYKLWHPVVGTWLDFHDARVELDPDAGTFTVRIAPARVDAAPVTDAPSLVTGRFTVAGGLVRTAAVLIR
ncbi:4-phosphopantetheinyl transferase [Micromonospora globispora]|uniref:4-phosphopantetheinyl transferase n=1 Tax=Micromonospora globispora TaxID=1450148 RepID=A0A317JQX3_9ACTN|nr:4'-phosphopantetheinyl transferase superfamily protein [Micromonospora globispora]PWU43231.1 4-phosphopantetheinyl transferase [Micromonospora globispora]PWU58277.1 4-phosphopantetheinyl transferase [Micromonospora globispora]RQW88986.1 4-phosphopantetheinyl transferase [Micromonospora globispora]